MKQKDCKLIYLNRTKKDFYENEYINKLFEQQEVKLIEYTGKPTLLYCGKSNLKVVW